ITQITKRKDIETGIITNVITEDYMQNIYIISNYSTPMYAKGKLDAKAFENFAKSEEYKTLQSAETSFNWLGYHKTLDDISGLSTDSYSMACFGKLNAIGKNEIGYVIIDISPDFVKQAIADSNLPPGSLSALVTADGREIFSDDEAVPEGFSFAGEGFVADGATESGCHYVTYNGSQYLFLYAPLTKGNSYVYSLVPKQFIVKQAQSVKTLTIVMVLVGTLIAILCGIIMASGIGGTIHKINKVLERTAAGDLSITAKIKRKDEFHILGNSINNTINSMKQLIYQILGVSTNVSDSAAQVSGNSDMLLVATRSITQAVNDIEQGVNQQAEDAEQCLIQMSALAEQIENVSMNAEEIDRAAENTRDTVKEGITIIGTLGDAAKETTKITGVMIHDIEELQGKSNSISSIVHTINDIAEQTNLLSLNASIEAARAGAAGKGFAVVADEIRKLAEQSQEAAGEIGTIISQIQSKTMETATNAKKAEESVHSQENALEDTVKVFEDIQQSVEGLSKNLLVISDGMGQIEKTKDGTLEAIQSISATSEETAAAATELGVTADEQLKAVEILNQTAKELGQNAKNLEDSVRVFKLQ
ncbi:MAG: methyl-accepting chemotaxis protein, partial [Clostridiales bacterium]|nr:methyl-accepting chemotaxis protein [Clostridiales bacterium]